LNPYAAPKAKLEEAVAEGSVWREGNLVRVDRDGSLPSRCVVCNLPAETRVRRRLYTSPLAWRLSAFITPFVLMWLGLLLQATVLMMLFWPSIIVLLVVHLFVRRKFVLDAPICARHARLRTVLLVFSILLVCAVIALPFGWSGTTAMINGLWACIAALILLAAVQSIAGVQAVRLKRLSAEYAWLGGTGKPFREALPELPG
jgi:hypothetical protein